MTMTMIITILTVIAFIEHCTDSRYNYAIIYVQSCCQTDNYSCKTASNTEHTKYTTCFIHTLQLIIPQGNLGRGVSE